MRNQRVVKNARKSLKSWSGRRDSNPRRPAWEIDPTLKIKDMGSMALISGDFNPPVFNSVPKYSS